MNGSGIIPLMYFHRNQKNEGERKKGRERTRVSKSLFVWAGDLGGEDRKKKKEGGTPFI